MSRARLSVALSLVICGLLACGGDDDSPGHVTTERPPPMGDAAMPDANSDDAGDDAPSDAGPTRDAAEPIPCDDEKCEASSNDCVVAACDHVRETCLVGLRDDGTPCGDPTSTECSGPNVCSSSHCVPNDLPAGTPCGQTSVDCRLDDQCNGEGLCVVGGLAPEGSPCGSDEDTDCDHPDTCDALGTCQPNYAGVDQPCGTIGALCHYDDSCDGSGTCTVSGPLNPSSSCPPDYPRVPGFGCSCGDQENRESCTPDVCVNGACITRTRDENEPCGLDNSLCCNASQACGTCI